MLGNVHDLCNLQQYNQLKSVWYDLMGKIVNIGILYKIARKLVFKFSNNYMTVKSFFSKTIFIPWFLPFHRLTSQKRNKMYNKCRDQWSFSAYTLHFYHSCCCCCPRGIMPKESSCCTSFKNINFASAMRIIVIMVCEAGVTVDYHRLLVFTISTLNYNFYISYILRLLNQSLNRLISIMNETFPHFFSN